MAWYHLAVAEPAGAFPFPSTESSPRCRRCHQRFGGPERRSPRTPHHAATAEALRSELALSGQHSPHCNRPGPGVLGYGRSDAPSTIRTTPVVCHVRLRLSQYRARAGNLCAVVWVMHTLRRRDVSATFDRDHLRATHYVSDNLCTSGGKSCGYGCSKARPLIRAMSAACSVAGPTSSARRPRATWEPRQV